MLDNNIFKNLKPKIKLDTRRYRGTNDQCDVWESPIDFYDHFVSNNIEYIIYPSYNFDYFSPILSEKSFNNKINKHGLCIAYKYIDNVNKKIKNDSKYNISIATLFYDDRLHYLPFFFEHYKNIGVDKFYMYYNGNLSARLNELPKISNVEYIEWNFPYYIVNENKTIVANCQSAFLNTYIRKYGSLSNYNILIDVDEIILCKDLKRRLCDEKSHIFLDHRLTYIKDGQITIEDTCNDPKKGKTIIKTDLISPETFIHIHHFSPMPEVSNIKFLHVKPPFNEMSKQVLSKYINQYFKNE